MLTTARYYCQSDIIRNEPLKSHNVVDVVDGQFLSVSGEI